jgi:DNA-binding response OmpR family regulator
MEETRATILVIDDDPKIRRLLTRLLTQEGFDLLEADGPRTGLETLEHDKPDLVLLDVMLQDSDGIDVLQRIRATSEVPVILLTALGEEADRILGLRSGADDYVVKPFSPGELTARIDSVLRRSKRVTAQPDMLSFGDLCIDTNTRDVHLDGTLVSLTAKEFDLLTFLATSPRHVFTRGQLLTRVWGSSSEWQDPATVTEHIRRVRKKIEADPDHPRYIVTVRGVGYRFEP